MSSYGAFAEQGAESLRSLMDDTVDAARLFAKDLVRKGLMAYLGGMQRLMEGKPEPKQTLEEMDEKMRKKLGLEHKDVADAVVNTERHLRAFAKALAHFDMSHPDEFKQMLVDKEGDLLTSDQKKKIMERPPLELTKEAKRRLRKRREDEKGRLSMNRTPKRLIYPGPPPPPGPTSCGRPLHLRSGYGNAGSTAYRPTTGLCHLGERKCRLRLPTSL